MKLAIMTIAFNEQETIGAVLRNWKGIDHYVFLSERPWHGYSHFKDNTEEIASTLGARVIKGNWRSETQQRNEALTYLQDYDYVLIIDADELYTEVDKKIILDTLENGAEDGIGRLKKENCYRIPRVKTYWKSTDYILDPPDTHKPVIAINPKEILFKEFRIPNTDWQPIIDVEMHHLSYCKSAKKTMDKIQQFEHYHQIPDEWFEETWLNWNETDTDIRPYGKEKSKAIYKPLPEELKNLI